MEKIDNTIAISRPFYDLTQDIGKNTPVYPVDHNQ